MLLLGSHYVIAVNVVRLLLWTRLTLDSCKLHGCFLFIYFFVSKRYHPKTVSGF